MPSSQVGMEVTQLLLARAPHLLDILERLFNRGPLGHLVQNRRRGGVSLRAKIGPPAVFLFHQYHANDATRRTPSRQEGLVGLGDFVPVQDHFLGLPAFGVPGALRQAEDRATIGWLATTLAGRLLPG